MKRRVFKSILSLCLTSGLILVGSSSRSTCTCSPGQSYGTCSSYRAIGYPKIVKIGEECFEEDSWLYYFQCSPFGHDQGTCNEMISCNSRVPVECPPGMED